TLRLMARAGGSVMAMNFLTLSLSPGDMINLLRQLRLPELLIDLITFCHRFIYVLFGTAETIRIAQYSRGGYRSPVRAFRSFALLASNLLANALVHGRRVHLAMLGRGYQGRLHGFPKAYRWDARLFAIHLLVIASLLGVWG
ncbi:MAG: energy-coupling factor transporter transmembrane protein EcfT, partial [bacterium]|nr:energy-coupling factor transporter transmembrane protein EcfT [bacterium]